MLYETPSTMWGGKQDCPSTLMELTCMIICLIIYFNLKSLSKVSI